MPLTKPRIKSKDSNILILAIDIDNDLYRKTGISGPLMGRVQNLNGASQLALADPEDSDSNTMFYAVHLYDKMKDEGYSVEVATVTGSEKEGYEADKEVARQLELVLNKYKSDECILVTDGPSDERVLPIIQSRVKISSVQQVIIKQAEGAENTYYAIMEKLKEPHFARTVFGLPALILILFAVSYFLGTGWILPVALIGIYLLAKGFGLEEALINSFKGLGFSIDRMSFVFYMSAILFAITGVFIAANNYTTKLMITGNQAVSIAYMVEGFLVVLPIILILYLIGRFIDVRDARYYFRTFKYAIFIGSAIILWTLLYSFTEWFMGQIYFSQLVDYIILAIFIGVAVSGASRVMRRRMIRKKNLKGKIVVNDLGAMIGKIAGVDLKRGRMIINTGLGSPITYSVDKIIDLSDKVIIKQ
jgi:putative membrane protein